jgi:hypothetical protein
MQGRRSSALYAGPSTSCPCPEAIEDYVERTAFEQSFSSLTGAVVRSFDVFMHEHRSSLLDCRSAYGVDDSGREDFVVERYVFFRCLLLVPISKY